MSYRLKLAILGLIVVAAAVFFGGRQGASAQPVHQQVAAHHTIYPDGGSDPP
jgi:hypothetical protein